MFMIDMQLDACEDRYMEANNTPNIITGHDAIAYAEINGMTLNKYEDPTEDARTGLTVDEAKQVAFYDRNLIWIDASRK